jgi:hypothetical protein
MAKERHQEPRPREASGKEEERKGTMARIWAPKFPSSKCLGSQAHFAPACLNARACKVSLGQRLYLCFPSAVTMSGLRMDSGKSESGLELWILCFASGGRTQKRTPCSSLL